MTEKLKKRLKGTGIAALIIMILSGVDLTTFLDGRSKPADSEIGQATEKLQGEIEVMRVMAEHRELQIKIKQYDQMLRPAGTTRQPLRSPSLIPVLPDANSVK